MQIRCEIGSRKVTMVTRVERVRARAMLERHFDRLCRVVITLCLTCFTFNSAVSLVVTDNIF